MIQLTFSGMHLPSCIGHCLENDLSRFFSSSIKPSLPLAASDWEMAMVHVGCILKRDQKVQNRGLMYYFAARDEANNGLEIKCPADTLENAQSVSWNLRESVQR